MPLLHDPYAVLRTEAKSARFYNKCYPRTRPIPNSFHKSGRYSRIPSGQRTTSLTSQAHGPAARIHPGRAGISFQPRIWFQSPARSPSPAAFVLRCLVGTPSYHGWTRISTRRAICLSGKLSLEHHAPLFRSARIYTRPRRMARDVFPFLPRRRARITTTPIIMDCRPPLSLRVRCGLLLSRMS